MAINPRPDSKLGSQTNSALRVAPTHAGSVFIMLDWPKWLRRKRPKKRKAPSKLLTNELSAGRARLPEAQPKKNLQKERQQTKDRRPAPRKPASSANSKLRDSRSGQRKLVRAHNQETCRDCEILKAPIRKASTSCWRKGMPSRLMSWPVSNRPTMIRNEKSTRTRFLRMTCPKNTWTRTDWLRDWQQWRLPFKQSCVAI